MEYKIFLGYLAAIIAFISYIVYFKLIFAGKIKPHAFSWFIWGVLQSTAFVAQIVKGAGAGAWATGITALASFAISAWSLYKGERKFSKLDWGFFTSALFAIFLWWITKEPLLSIILVTITDALASVLTAQKGYYEPFKESATYFGLSVVKWTAGIFALNTYVVVTWLYPASLIFTNAIIVLVLLVRRKQLKSTQTTFQHS